jgi:hypothetical protein
VAVPQSRRAEARESCRPKSLETDAITSGSGRLHGRAVCRQKSTGWSGGACETGYRRAGADHVQRTEWSVSRRVSLSGRYVLTFDLSGFVPHQVRDLDVAEASVTLDVMLRVTSFAEQIRVAADLDEIHTTGSRLGLTRHEMPASIDIVTQDLIQARGADTASTALRYVTGITVVARHRPASTLVDPFIRVAFGRAADLTVRVKNLSNERYVDWATRAFGVTNVYFGEPRRLVVSLRVRLQRVRGRLPSASPAG